MRIKFVYGILPAFIIYTDKFLKPQNGGETRLMFIMIRSRFKDSEALLIHGLTHVKQCYRLLIIPHGLLLRFSGRYEQKIELEAYANQLKYHIDTNTFTDDKIDIFVNRIYKYHNKMGYSKERIRKLLLDKLKD